MATSQRFLPFRSTVGLLTTVAELPHNYKIRYITPESPLDLTIKTTDSLTPPSTPSPLKKRYRAEIDCHTEQQNKIPKIEDEVVLPKKETTPLKPTKSNAASKTLKNHPVSTKERKHKAVRKLKFDENKSSPVSGTIIRTLDEIEQDNCHESGDIDPQYNIVEVTDEAKAEIAAIPNVIGGYACKLCQNEFEDAFGLARHRCSCIVLLEYRCPECGKRFNCPANLASHRRWHKPKDEVLKKQENNENEQQFPCSECGKFFKRQAYLRKHLATHKNKMVAKKVSRNSESSNSLRSEDSNSCDSLPKRNFDEYNYAKREHTDSELSSSSFSAAAETNFRAYGGTFTDEENIAAAALANLRNGPSVIRHTTALAV
ncbi:insulinoma-associated protein 1b [Bradysia coprophila]|uniref:insulinoma-associated protein 1b n=1 Tax=Bradysia coprophila TaxID=38358 RepID=UPI00187D9371|nr:insulinoma-associated protein 1b [Bradysia coprophila]